ncbi:hypothetical protein [Shinella sp.]|uniref:hypothetical protein n=1 Tax=Shinella sp. TaxID=1870904 RepID=UPI0029AA58A9|nr:hypothetical protein [Shinella sp.]MDX3973259.1 hypothetical protein [Shinella sp.]
MSNRGDIEALQLELWATQYWMKYLFVAQAKGERMRSTDIIDLIEEMKATIPPDRVSSPAEFDQRHVDRFPVYERVGLEIAALLREMGN